MSRVDELKSVAEELPADAVEELLRLAQARHKERTPFRAIPLGGRWSGYTITEQDIADARREMWSTLDPTA